MEKNAKSLIKAVRIALSSAAALVTMAAVFTACQPGLGTAVDTQAPTVEITYPPMSSVIKDSFVLAGNWDDDQGVKTVTITVVDASTKKQVGDTVSATVNSDTRTWSATLNTNSGTGDYNGWEYSDGTYQFTVTARDSAGHSTEASRTLEIDNTAPVFILSSLQTFGSDDASTYGRSFSLKGEYYDLNNIEGLSVKFLPYENDTLSAEDPIEFTFDSAAQLTSGLSVAEYCDSSALSYDEETGIVTENNKFNLRENYLKLYKNDPSFSESGFTQEQIAENDISTEASLTKTFYAVISLEDEAKTYQDASDEGSGDGNTSSEYYVRNTDFYKELMTKTTYNLDSEKLSDILSGLYKNESRSVAASDYSAEDIAAIKELLAKYTVSSDKVTTSASVFSINPDNAPRYAVNGYEIGLDDDGNAINTSASAESDTGYRTVTPGSDLYVTFTCGRDQTEIEPATVTIKMYCMGSDADNALNAVSTVADTVQTFLDKTSTDSMDTSWSYKLSLDSSVYSLAANNYYRLEISGQDIEGNEAVSDNSYGFKIESTGKNPELTITSVADEVYSGDYAASSGLVIKGTVEPDAVEMASKDPVTVSLTVTDTTTNEEVSGITFTADDCVPVKGTGSTYNFEYNVTDLKVPSGTKRYKYQFTVTVKDANSKTSKDKYSVYVDTKAPEISVTSTAGYVADVAEIAATATDNTGLKDISYSIYESTDTKFESPVSFYPVASVSDDGTVTMGTSKVASVSLGSAGSQNFRVNFGGVNAAGEAPVFEDGGKYVIRFTATDDLQYGVNAGYGITDAYTVDHTAPSFADSTIKIGGSAYDASAWFKDSSVEVSGNITESGSAVKAVYYQIASGTTGTMTVSNYTDTSVRSGVFSTTVLTGDDAGTETFAQNVKLTAGTNTLTLIAVDNVGNVSSVVTKTIKYDSDKPTVTASASATTEIVAGASTSVSGITFSTSDASSGVDSVTVMAGDVTLVNGTNATITSSSGTYTVTIGSSALEGKNGKVYVTAVAEDAAGNESNETTVAIINVDSTLPTVSISTAACYVKDTLTVNANASDNTSVASLSYNVYLSGDASKTVLASGDVTVSSSPSFDVDFAAVDSESNYIFADGSAYVVELTATDAAGNTGSAVSAAYTVDRTAPVLVTGVSGKVETIDGKSAASSGDSWLNKELVTITGWYTENGSGIDAVYYQVYTSTPAVELTGSTYETATNVSAISAKADGDYKKYTSNITISTGTNTLKFVAVDKVGNVSEVQTRTIKYDAEVPVVTASDTSTKITKNTAVSFGFTGADGDGESGIASYALTAGTVSRAVSSDEIAANAVTLSATEISSLAEGNNTVSLTATDAAGNTCAAVTIGTVNKDTTAPVAIISSPEANAGVNGTVTVKGTVSDTNTGVASITVYLTSTATRAASDPVTIAAADFGTNGSWEAEFDTSSMGATAESAVISAIATDNAGNKNTPASGNSDYVAISVDQNTDRPEIQLDLDSSTAWLTSEKLRITVTDDDGVSDFKVTETAPSTTGFAWSSVTSLTKNATGSYYEYDPSTDGDHTLYFYVKDTEGKEFASGAASELNQPYYSYKTGAAASASAGVKVSRDTQAPKIGTGLVSVSNTTAGLAAVTTVASSTSSYTFKDKYAGGDYKYFKLYIPVYDTYVNASHGSVSVTVYDSEDTDNADENYYVGGSTEKTAVIPLTYSSSTQTKDSKNYYYFVSDYVDVSAVTTSTETASKNLIVTAEDDAGNVKTYQYTLYVDNCAPTITPKTPASGTEEVTGSISIAGTASDGSLTPGIADITWFLPTKAQVTSLSSEEDGHLTEDDFVSGSDDIVNGNVNSGTTTQWEFAFDGVTTPRISNWVPETLTNTGSNDYATLITGTSLWSVPVYFRVTDELGNSTLYKDYTLRYNPDGDKATASILYPENVESETSTDAHATVGGSIRINGSASDNESVKAVYMQFAFGTSSDSGANVSYSAGYDLAAFKTKLASTSATYNEVTTAGSSGVPADGDSTKTYNIYSTTSAGILSGNTDSWWGVKVTGTNSWYTTINALKEFNGANGAVSYVKVRVCAVDNNGKAGEWSEGVSLWIDNAAPVIRDAQLVGFDDDVAEASVMTTSTTKSQSYTADMYVKDVWYLDAYLVDDTQVTAVTVTENGNEIYSVEVTYDEADDGTKTYNDPVYSVGNENYLVEYDKAASGDDSAEHGFHLRYPVSASSGTGSNSYRIVIQDANSTKTEASYSINYDNVAPVFTTNLQDDSDTDLGIFTSGTQTSMKKVHNSNYTFTFGNTVSDSGAGFERLAYYFLRGSTTVELPVPAASGSGWTSGTAVTETISTSFAEDEETGLYGEVVTGTRSDSISFTSSDLPSYVREGGLIQLGGIFYLITDVSGTTVTFDGTVDTSETEAFFPMAFVVDNVEDGSMSSGVYTYSTASPDDGDGVFEYIKKEGTSRIWQTSVYSDELTDGVVTIVCVAFDKAGNCASQSTSVMISNRAPRLANVYAAVDLNANGTFDESEIVKKSARAGESDSGDLQQIANLSDTGLTMTDSLGLAFEFTSAANDYGYGAGQGDLYYLLGDYGTAISGTVAPITADDPDDVADDGNKVTAYSSSSLNSAFATTGDTAVAASKLPGITLEASDFYASSAAVTLKDGNTYTEGSKNYLNITLWDNANGNAGTVDTADASNAGYYTAFGGQYTVITLPVTMDLIDGSAPAVTFEDPVVSGSAGHVDTISDELKVSGKIEFTGTVTEERHITSLTLASSTALKMYLNSTDSTYHKQQYYCSTCAQYFDSEVESHNGADGETACAGTLSELTLTTLLDSTAKTVASFASGTLNETTAASASSDSWKFEITDQSFSATTTDEVKAGHTVSWKLTVDTETVTGIAANDVTFTLTASDGTNSTASTKTVDIVPYITGIVRSGTTISEGKMNRSKNGRYAVAEGESIVVSGYNFGVNGSWTVGTNNTTTAYAATLGDNGIYSFTMTVPARSGALSVTANSVGSLNNSNSNTVNTESYEMQGSSTSYTSNDDRYLSVWNLGNYFNNTSNGVELQQPVMTADASGNLYASWAAQSNSNIMFSYGVANGTTAIFRCYDQPSTYTGIAYDTKSSTSGGASVAFIPEHQGAGGTFSKYALSSSIVVGGAGAINIPSKYLVSGNATYYHAELSGLAVNVDGNPYYDLDSSGNSSNYYNLANYDMTRRLGSYENPHSAKYGNYMHSIWYDNVTESLKYSVVDTSSYEKYNKNAAGIVGWVVIDGGYTGQDRLHEFNATENTNEANTTITNNMLKSYGYLHTGLSTAEVNWKTGRPTGKNSTFSTDVFFAESNISESDETSVTYTGKSGGITPAVGDTIALLQNNDGDYAISLRTITDVTGTKLSWSEDVTHDIDTFTVYSGDMNVVGQSGTDLGNFSSVTVSGSAASAGSSAAIDVTTTGLPVIAYYDATNSKLKVAVASSVEPDLASEWTRLDTGKTCSGEVSMKVDGANNLHIMYNNGEGKMCYVFGTYSSGSYTFGSEEIVDENGSLSYGSISVVYNGSTYIPAMTYLNKANTANAVKYAYRTAASSATGTWDMMIIPALGTGHYAIKENPISLESSNYWTSTTATVLQNELDDANANYCKTATPATVDSVIAYKTSSAYETAYLKKE